MDEATDCADDEQWDLHVMASNAIDCKVSKAIVASGQKKVRVQYSAYKSDDADVPIDNLDEIAANGKVVLISPRTEFYGGPKSRDYRSEPLQDPTWLQVAVCANAMISATRDRHHCFLEGLDEVERDGDATTYSLVMGS